MMPSRQEKQRWLTTIIAFSAISFYGIILVVSPNHLQKLILDGFNVASENNLVRATTGTGKNAYAFLIAGCNPSTPEQYLGFIYNILAASYILSATNSQNDIVVMVRMGTKSTMETLPPKEEQWLRSAGCIIRYLPKMNDERSDSFYTAMLDKFQVLDWIEYDKVLFLDSDVIPICNLDYLFEIMPSGSSESGGNHFDTNNESTLMRHNLVIAWNAEPSNGGFFILTPGKGQLDELKEIIRRQAASEYAKTKWPPFDEIDGWGHNITWKDAFKMVGHKWDFHGGFADQGLLYMWTKYIKRDVSIVINDIVEHWTDQDGDGEVEKIGTSATADLIDTQSCSNVDVFRRGKLWVHAPYRDFNHFAGKTKPWLPKIAKMIPPDVLKSHEGATHPVELWYHALRKQVEKLNMGNDIDVDHWNMNLTLPPLGLYPSYYTVMQHANAVANISVEESK